MSDLKKRYNCLVYLDATAQVSFEILQIKLLEELKLPRISMFYTDEEGDEVSIGSQEELDEAMKAAGAPSDLLCIRVCTQGGEAHLTQRVSGSGAHYSQLAQMVGVERKSSAECGKACPPKWFSPAMSENNAYLLDEINRAFNEAVVVLSSIRNAPGGTPGTGGNGEMNMHYKVICDCCKEPIYGVRYKCGNCVNYDLCEACEGRSQEVHCPYHVFLKMKVPAPSMITSKPLLRMNLYSLTQEDGEEANSSGLDDNTLAHPECVQKTREELKEELKKRKLEKKMATKGAGPDGVTPTHTEGMCAAPAYVEKTREELKEEIRRKKQEKKMAAHAARLSPHGLGREEALKHDLKMLKMEKKRKKKMAKLQDHGVLLPGMAADSCEGSAAQDGGKCHKGVDKYLAAMVVADRNYPPGSVIPCGQPFEKSWVVANTGTKTWKDVRLVHQVGYTPVSTEIDVPDLNPEEQTILTVEYPPVGMGQQNQITSSWRLIRKGHTPFGPTLWLSVLCDREALAYPQGTMGTTQAPPTFGFTTAELHIVTLPIQQQQQQLEVVATAPVPPGGAAEGPKSCEGDLVDMCSSVCSERLVQMFEMVSQVSQKSSAPVSEIDPEDRPCEEDREGHLGASDDDEFVVVIPDCFNLEVPLPELISLHSSKCEEPASCSSSTPVVLNNASLGGSTDIFGECGGMQGGDQGEERAVVGGKSGCDGAGDGDCSKRGGDGCGHESGDDECGAGDSECGAGDDECGAGDDGCGAGDDECGGSDDECGGSDDECGGGDGCSGPVNSGSDGVVGTSSDISEATAHQDGTAPSSQQDACAPSPSVDEKLSSQNNRKLPPSRTVVTAVPSGSRFTLQEMSLRRVLDARITNPITIATAAINTATKFVSDGVHISPSRGAAAPRSGTTAAPPSGPLAEDEDKFEDAPEPSESCPPSTTQQVPLSATTNPAPPVTSYLDRDVTRFLPHSNWEQPKWTGPPCPSTPMDRLIGMGFANRELNSQLLEKHGNNIQAVLNELLDGRDSESVRV